MSEMTKITIMPSADADCSFFPLNTWSAEWISSLNRDVLTIKRKNNSMALQCGSSKSSMTNLTHLTQEQPQPQHRWVGSVDHHWVDDDVQSRLQGIKELWGCGGAAIQLLQTVCLDKSALMHLDGITQCLGLWGQDPWLGTSDQRKGKKRLKDTKIHQEKKKNVAGETRLPSTPLSLPLNGKWGEVWKVAMAAASVWADRCIIKEVGVGVQGG